MMIPFNGDIQQAMKWLQNKAPGIQGVVLRKKNWYAQYNADFWSGWYDTVFNIQTATPFGLMVWCIILGVPSGAFGLYPNSASWAFGKNRENFIYSGSDPNFKDPSTGGNFYGGGTSEILDLSEISKLLRTRYVALVSNGNLKYINFMLNYIWGGGKPWDFAGGKYFIAVDCTSIDYPGIPAFRLEYHIGPNMGLSSQLINVMNDASMGIMPTTCGSKTTTIQD